MENVLNGLQPELVFKYFEEISVGNTFQAKKFNK